MQLPLQITFREMIPSDAVSERIREKINKLDKTYLNITACRVVVGQTENHPQQGKLHNVSIYMSVPGKEITVNHHPNENLYLAIQQATDILREQLDEYHRRLHGDTKDHGVRLSGEVVRLFADEDYGFIVDGENNEYYFNLTHLVDIKFNQLRLGDKVRFLPAVGNEGLQARRISVPKRERIKETH